MSVWRSVARRERERVGSGGGTVAARHRRQLFTPNIFRSVYLFWRLCWSGNCSLQCQPQLVEGDQIAVENLTRFQPAKAAHRLRAKGGRRWPYTRRRDGLAEVTEAAAISRMLLFLARGALRRQPPSVPSHSEFAERTRRCTLAAGAAASRTSPAGSRSRLRAAASRRPASRPSWRAMRARTARRHTHRPRRSAFPHTRPPYLPPPHPLCCCPLLHFRPCIRRRRRDFQF